MCYPLICKQTSLILGWEKNLCHPHFLLVRVVSALIDISSPPPYHWRSTSSPEENNFIHWLHLILHLPVRGVSRGATSCKFLLPAASQHTKKPSLRSVEKGGAGFPKSSCTKRDTAEIDKHCLALWRELKEWKI